MPETSNTVGREEMNTDEMRQRVEKALTGDQEAFGDVVRFYHPRVYGLVYGMVNNPDDARDLAQQTWVKAWTKLPTFKKDADFFTWVYRIAANTCLDFLRWRTRRREEPLTAGPDMAEDRREELADAENRRPDREVEHAEIRRVFEKALEELTPEHRLILTLREVDGLSYEEIASVTGCRKGTVMSRLFYARQHMQKKLEGLS